MKMLTTLILPISFGFILLTMVTTADGDEINEGQGSRFDVAQQSNKDEVKTSKAVQLSTEDRARMTRLKEEVLGRLHEMGMIVSRNLGNKVDDMVPLFIPFKDKAAGITSSTRNGGLDYKMLSRGTTPARMQMVCFFEGGSLIGCGCYNEEEGTCSPC